MDWIAKLNRGLATIVFVTARIVLIAQDTARFPKENWDKATEGLEYGPVKEAEVQNTRELPNFSFSGGDWLLYLIAAILLALIVFLIVKVLDKNQASGKSKIGSARDYNLDDIEENLKEMDLDDYLRKALADQDYRAAIRLNYLRIIQLLDQRSLIKWQRDKTNRDYIHELSDHQGSEQFRQITGHYEHIWYGDLTLSREEFLTIEPPFNAFFSDLNSTDGQ